MNGAEALWRTLAGGGVDVCFTNPGTSEMHLVAALDAVTEVRGVLVLFEGVATGAADGFARIAGRPAATLLHLGPGLSNGLANLHNARRARTPVVSLVGDHARDHQRLDAPLQSDIASLARPVSGWHRASVSPEDVAADAAEAVAAAFGPPGQVATLVVPADCSWLETGGGAATVPPPRAARQVDDDVVASAAKALRSGGPAALLVGGRAGRRRGLEAAARVAAATGAALLGETLPSRLERGAGLPAPERLAYLPELAITRLSGLRHLVLVDAPAPVSFFAYPGLPGELVPPGCEVHSLGSPDEDVLGALESLADLVGAPAQVPEPLLSPARRPPLPSGALDAVKLGAVLGALLPEDAIVVDEGITAGIHVPDATAGCPPHDWLGLVGGAIGQGLPLATGAALAAADRPVVCLEADGSAAYTIQALWTQAREGLHVTTVLLDNRAYGILEFELARAGARGEGTRAREVLELSPPAIDFVALARGFGVPARRADTVEALVAAVREALDDPGPHLIQAVLPPGLG
jgi:acetolactate synthase-1/2/3 large subunit